MAEKVCDTFGIVVVHEQEVLRRGLSDMVNAIPEVSRWTAVGDIQLPIGLPPDSAVSILVLSLDARQDLDSALSDDGPVPNEEFRTVVIIPTAAPAEIERATQLGADAYVMLGELTIDVLRRALVDVRDGCSRLPNAISDHLLRRARNETTTVHHVENLSPRERDVLGLVLDGLSNKDIARHLGISIHGVKRYVSSILGKYNSPSRAHLVSTVLRTATRDLAPSYG